MREIRVLLAVLLACAAASLVVFAADGVGNPRPGYPHDTIVIHVMSDHSGPKDCDGGHSLFLRHSGGILPETRVDVTMLDWAQVDNDGDGVADEDLADGLDNDGDGLVDEDGLEPGAVTTALDCDAYGDGAVKLQIRDTDPRHGWVSTQEWFMRLIGKPGQNFAFTSYANQTVSCTLLADPDGVPNTGDETVECTSGTTEDWVMLASFNLRDLGCVKSVKLGGKGSPAGGRTPFCDVTGGFLVDVDQTNDGVIDLFDQFVFSVSCVDDPLTLLNEQLYCPLSSIIWDVDEEETSSQAKAQIFVSHTGAAQIQGGKIK